MKVYENNKGKIYLYKMIKNLCMFLGLYFLIQIDYPLVFKETIYFKLFLLLIIVNACAHLISFIKNTYKHAVEISKE